LNDGANVVVSFYLPKLLPVTLISTPSCNGLHLCGVDPTFSFPELLHATLLSRFFYGGLDPNLSFSLLELLPP